MSSRYTFITDRTAEDVANGTDKGYYNETDLNRVANIVKSEAERWGLGILPIKDDWLKTDIPFRSDMNSFYQGVCSLLEWVLRFGAPGTLPQFWFSAMTYDKANRLEQLVQDMCTILEAQHISCFESDEIWSNSEVFSG